MPTSWLEPRVSSKVVEKDRLLSKEDEITASIRAGNASLSITSESSTKTIKPNRKSGGPKLIQPGSDAKSDSSSQKRKAFKPKQGKHFLVRYFDPLWYVEKTATRSMTKVDKTTRRSNFLSSSKFGGDSDVTHIHAVSLLAHPNFSPK